MNVVLDLVRHIKIDHLLHVREIPVGTHNTRNLTPIYPEIILWWGLHVGTYRPFAATSVATSTSARSDFLKRITAWSFIVSSFLNGKSSRFTKNDSEQEQKTVREKRENRGERSSKTDLVALLLVLTTVC